MRRAVSTIATTASLLVMLTACGDESIDETAQVASSSLSMTTAATTESVPDVCEGTAGCTPLATADVDGDGKPDSIALVGSDIEVLAATGVRARTGAGDTDRIADPALRQHGGFVGAFDVTGKPGAEIVVADQSMGGASRYRVLTWESGKLALTVTPAVFASGPPVIWSIFRGEGQDVAVRCTDDAATPFEVWSYRTAYGNSGPSKPTMTVTSYGRDTDPAFEGPMFVEVDSYQAVPEDLGSLPGMPWLCGANAVGPAEKSAQQCGSDSRDTAIVAGLRKLPAHRIPGAAWVFDGETDFDPCADLSYAVADTAGGTGSSPIHLMFFHRGEYVGTATSCAFGKTTVTGSTPSSVDVQYRYPRGMESNAGASGLATTTFAWDGERVVMQSDLPAELLTVNGC